MRILAYVDLRYQNATRRVVGSEAIILTSPPIGAADVNAEWFEDQDLIYLDLHGRSSSVYLWSGPSGLSPALGLRTVQTMRLGKAVVFSTTCYLPETQFVDAFLKAGALAVIAGEGQNWGTQERISGAQELALHLIRYMETGKPVKVALQMAKRRLRYSLSRVRDRQAAEDALEFKLFHK